MNVKYYPAHLSALIIDANLAMGAHGITLGAAQTVDGIDVSLQKTNMDNLIRQMHPNVSVLAAVDEATYTGIYKSGDNYLIAIPTNYNQSFDGLADGNLNGQDSWVASSIFDVNADWRHGATGKGVRVATDAHVTANRAITSIPHGTFIFYVYSTHQVTGYPNTFFTLRESGADKFGIYVSGGSFKYLNASASYVALPTPTSYVQNTWYKVEVTFNSNTNKYESIKIDDVEKGSDLDAQTSTNIDQIYIDKAAGSAGLYNRIDDINVNEITTTGDVFSDAIAANSAVISFFSQLKCKFSNGDSTHSDPVQVEIYGNGDAYAAALNATTKFKIDVADPRIELYRIDDSEVAKSGAQEDWVLDDNATNGAFAAKTTSTHETILAEEIGCASVVMVEKSVNGLFTDTEILVEDDDYTVDYSTRTATKIILTTAEAADVTISQSKLRITWIADVEDIEGTANTALKMKIYLSRTNTGEASPEIQKVDLGTDKYAEMKYTCG